MKRKIAILMTICMMVTMIPATAFAGTNDVAGKDYKVASYTPSAEAEQARQDVRDAAAEYLTDIEDEMVAPATPAAGEEKDIPLPEVDQDIQKDTQKVKALAKGKVEASTEYVAYLNGYVYSTLQYAVEDSGYGDTITLIADATLQGAVIQNKDITIDMNGYYLGAAYSDAIVITSNSDVTIKNGSIINVGSGNGIMIMDGSDVYLEEVGFSTAGEQAGSVLVFDSDATVYDCAFLNGSIMDNYPTSPIGVFAGEYGVAVVEDSLMAFDDGIGILVGEGGVAGSYDNLIYATEGIGIGVNYDAGAVIEYGNYIATSPVFNNGGYVEITEGLFEAEYYDTPAISSSGSNNGSGIELTSGSIATPKDWRTVDRDTIAIYKNMAKPGNTKVNLNGTYNKIKATWNGVSGATGYYVYYKKGTGTYKLWGTTANKNATIKGLAAGCKYTVKVVPYKEMKGEYATVEAKGTKFSTATTTTLKKVVLNSFQKSNGKVKVRWKNINGETGYQISKSTKSGGTNIVATVANASATSKLISATKGKNYYYKVRAYKTVNGTKIYGPWSAVKKYKR